MTQIKANFVDGRLSEEIKLTDTTMISAGLRDLPVVAAPNYSAVVLDPTGSRGPQEIVYIIAHEANSDTAVIQREREGTARRPHSKGQLWIHSLLASDLTPRVFVQPGDPKAQYAGVDTDFPDTYIWIETGLGDGSDLTFWVEDGS